MKAVTWQGSKNMKVEDVPDPTILNPRDVIIKVTSSGICGSDVHLYDGVIPTLQAGDILGHEPMGEIVEVGPAVKHKWKVGDRVVVPFTIACGACFFCSRKLWSCCDNSNPNSYIAEKLMGFSPSGLFGYTHMLGGYAGGQAQYLRVPFADVGPIKIPDGVRDDQVVFLSDIFPTGYMAAENCDIQPGDTVAIWGAGPVGQFAAASAKLLGAERIVVIDNFPDRLEMAAQHSGAVTVNFDHENVFERLLELTGGRGPDSVLDAVGLEAHGHTIDAVYDRVKHALRMVTDRITVLRQAIMACRKGGTLSIPGAYGGFADKFPIGALMEKGLTVKSGQTHMMRYTEPLLKRILDGEIDPSFVITQRLPIEQAPEAYARFAAREAGWMKVVLKPNGMEH